MSADEWELAFAELCAAYDRPCTDERRAAYRKSLGRMHVVRWRRIVDFCLGADGPERFPTVSALWRISRQLGRTRALGAKAGEPDPREGMSRLARIANLSLFRAAYGRSFCGIGKTRMADALALKAKLVRDAEWAEDVEPEEFAEICQSEFLKLLDGGEIVA